jgi:hypothetical protein
VAVRSETPTAAQAGATACDGNGDDPKGNAGEVGGFQGKRGAACLVGEGSDGAAQVAPSRRKRRDPERTVRRDGRTGKRGRRLPGGSGLDEPAARGGSLNLEKATARRCKCQPIRGPSMAGLLERVVLCAEPRPRARPAASDEGAYAGRADRG